MIIVSLVSAYPGEPEARAAIAAEHGHGDLPYKGIWVHPTPEQPLVHIFGNVAAQELEDGGWRRPEPEHRARLAGENTRAS